MLRCLELAKKGLGRAAPNPSVGCVIVYNDIIIGEGFTSPSGGNHAEVNAINSVLDKSVLSQAILYVTLEPCSHFGKTPPCSDLIVKHNIKQVVIGCVDDNTLVAGKGIEKLKNAGIKVIVGVLEIECKEQHKRFFTFQNKKRPYIILKWAETKNGFISPLSKAEKKPVWISNIYSRQLTHKWRVEEQAILVGTNTVLEDNPSLTTRDWKGKSPIRIVIDRNLKVDKTASVFDSKAKTIVITEKKASNKENIIFETIVFSKNLPQQICDILYEYSILSVIIEGGLQTLQSFIDANLWDESRVFKGDVNFKEGTESPIFKGKIVAEKIVKNDTLLFLRND